MWGNPSPSFSLYRLRNRGDQGKRVRKVPETTPQGSCVSVTHAPRSYTRRPPLRPRHPPEHRICWPSLGICAPPVPSEHRQICPRKQPPTPTGHNTTQQEPTQPVRSLWPPNDPEPQEYFHHTKAKREICKSGTELWFRPSAVDKKQEGGEVEVKREREMWRRGRVQNHRNTTAKEEKRQDSRGSYNVWNESGSGGWELLMGEEGKEAGKRERRCATGRRRAEKNVWTNTLLHLRSSLKQMEEAKEARKQASKLGWGTPRDTREGEAADADAGGVSPRLRGPIMTRRGCRGSRRLVGVLKVRLPCLHV